MEKSSSSGAGHGRRHHRTALKGWFPVIVLITERRAVGILAVTTADRRQVLAARRSPVVSRSITLVVTTVSPGTRPLRWWRGSTIADTCSWLRGGEPVRCGAGREAIAMAVLGSRFKAAGGRVIDG